MLLQSLFPELSQSLSIHPCVILQAPPGSGKTTQVPLELRNANWLTGKIIMLEPRRLAAKNSAKYMASLLGEPVGQTVGYRIRLDTKVSQSTKIEVVTEGVLTRILQSDPTLEDYGLVIFDEFHERSLQADLGLALCRQIQEILREDLPLLIMSATLDSERLSQSLDNAPIFTASGRPFKVTTKYRPPPPEQNLYRHMANVIQQSLQNETGSILAFLPGAAEIRQVNQYLSDTQSEHIQIFPLYGNLTHQQQELAIQPIQSPLKKVVLATNIAETSLTIEGIRIVIDSGMARVPLFDPGSGLTRLSTQRISRASSEQRKGRAGRIEEGICIRLWAEAENNQLSPAIMPEILNADLTNLVLELAQWGIQKPEELFWITLPPQSSFQQASELLHDLEALDNHRITEHGKQMLKLPIHPRFSHMILKAQAFNLTGLACTLAALLSERDLLAGKTQQTSLELRMDALKRNHSKNNNILKAAQQIASHLEVKPEFKPFDHMGFLLGLAYPDRLAKRRPDANNRYLLSGGRGACLKTDDFLIKNRWLVALQLDGNPKESRIFMAVPISPEQVDILTRSNIVEESKVVFNLNKQKVEGTKVKRFKHLILEESDLNDLTEEQVTQALLKGIQELGIHQLAWSKNLLSFRDRVNFVHKHLSEWPSMSDDELIISLEKWLAPFLNGIKRINEVKTDLLQLGLEYYLGYDKLTLLDQLAPTHYQVPSGSQIRLDYSQDIPILAVRLQEVFGLESTPKILNQQVPIMIHLLSPARRPVQVTQDLASFWKKTYQQVRKELKGRYSKHYWPEDPFQAEAIRGVRRKS